MPQDDIVNEVARLLRRQPDVAVVDCRQFGSFTLRQARPEWIDALLLVAIQYYPGRTVAALQLIPDDRHRTIDVPDMERRVTDSENRAWRWMLEQWKYDVPQNSVAVTNLAVLKGQPVREAARWENDQWELFAGPGPELAPDQVRVAELGTLLAVDPSLEAVVRLDVGKAIRRADHNKPWHVWGK